MTLNIASDHRACMSFLPYFESLSVESLPPNIHATRPADRSFHSFKEEIWLSCEASSIWLIISSSSFMLRLWMRNFMNLFKIIEKKPAMISHLISRNHNSRLWLPFSNQSNLSVFDCFRGLIISRFSSTRASNHNWLSRWCPIKGERNEKSFAFLNKTFFMQIASEIFSRTKLSTKASP